MMKEGDFMADAGYATAGSGVYASQIGWINFADVGRINPGETKTVTNNLANGYTVEFNVSFTEIPNVGVYLQPQTSPVSATAAFGNTAYLNIPGQVVLVSQPQQTSVSNFVIEIKLTDIVVRDSAGRRIENYSVIAADSERTNINEIWSILTNGASWVQLETMPAVGTTKNVQYRVDGLGSNLIITDAFSIPGTTTGNVPAGVFASEGATEVTGLLTVRFGNQGISFGILILNPLNAVFNCFRKR